MPGRGGPAGRDTSGSSKKPQVVPYEDEDGDLDDREEPGLDPAMLAWIASNSGRGGGGSGGDSSDTSGRGGRGLGRGVPTGNRSGHQRERSAKFRRVKPLPLVESEDARERGVPVPAVGLPEGIQRRVDAEVSFFITELLYHDVRWCVLGACSENIASNVCQWVGCNCLQFSVSC